MSDSVPVLSEAAELETRRRDLDSGKSEDDATTSAEGKKRRLFGLLKGKDGKKDAETRSKSGTKVDDVPTTPISPPRSGLTSPGSPSPSRVPGGLRSSSPRLLSPASSLIFERDVHDPAKELPADAEAHIPAHIATEDRIPPVLEASSIAIAENVDPDAVEIVTSSAHVPATASVPGSLSSPALVHSDSQTDDMSMAASMHSAYAAHDGVDVRRLSFISFADVVQAEHAEQQHQQSQSHSHTVEGLLASSSPPLSSGLDSNKSPFGLPVPGSPVGSTMSGEAVITESMSHALKLGASGGEATERVDGA